MESSFPTTITLPRINISVTISEIEQDPDMLSHFVFISPDEGTPAAEALAANAAIILSKGEKMLHKFRGMKRPKLKSLNLLKQMKKYTKQYTNTSLSKNIKGKVIDGVHELYTLTAGMILGMRVTTGHQTKPNECDLLKVEDFTFAEKIIFPARGNNRPPYCTPPHSLVHTFKFKSYAPKVFKRIREYFDIDIANYMLSVCGNYNYLEFISNSKSGQFFFYSHDGKYMIKTQTKDENKFLKRILPHYYKFITENPSTQLVRILGMHRVKMYHIRRKVHFVIMTSVFDTPQEIHTIYDLKGSLIGRAAKKKERDNGGVLKDMDLLTDNRKICVGSETKRLVMEQLSRDAYFLASLNIMDYSLLVGIHDKTRQLSGSLKSGDTGSHSNTPFRRRTTSDISNSSKNIEIVDLTVCDHIEVQSVQNMESENNVEESTGCSLFSDSTAINQERFSMSNSTPTSRSLRRRPQDNVTQKENLNNQEASSICDERNDYLNGIEEDEAIRSTKCDSDNEMYPPNSAVSSVKSPNILNSMSSGKGIFGAEGAKFLTQIIRPLSISLTPGFPSNESLLPSKFNDDAESTEISTVNAQKFSRYTYGPGQTSKYPWTSRYDNGIASCFKFDESNPDYAESSEKNQTDEIYYIGIIDILQQYNLHKRGENFAKVRKTFCHIGIQ